ncbi:MAG: 4Fe-4S binding protein [Faecalicoccus sp.]|nr:4Fe-4S binding protein [Faecalicoccus sp.]
METKDYLRYVVEEIHRTIVATVDDEGLPVTAAIDMMDYDDHSLYFLTAKGKNFYDRLIKRKYLAFTAMKGEDTLSSIAVSIRGKVREIGKDKLSDLFQKNPYMEKIYPTKASRVALTVFQIYEGSGEWFDLSKRPIERASFTFGDVSSVDSGYFISDACIGCGQCVEICPQNCILSDSIPYVIEQNHCLHCGNCMSVCPMHAIERR